MVKYNTGEKPGKGDYKCAICGNIINLDNDTDTMPPCPVKKCDGTEWEKE